MPGIYYRSDVWTKKECSCVPSRNGRTSLINSHGSANQDAIFDLEKYDPYIDKIRAFFVPSLEYRIRSLLGEFVYSPDSQLARQFPRFKKFVDTMATWKGPLNKIAEYEIDSIEEAIGNTVKRIMKDDLVTCFLDSIVLHRRLNKICRELDALGIEDNIVRSLNVWNFVNETDYWMDRDCCTNSDSATERRNTNASATISCNAKEPTPCEKVVEPLTRDGLYRDVSTEHARLSIPNRRAREYRCAPESSEKFLRSGEDDTNRSTRGNTITSLTDDDDKTGEFFTGKSRDTARKKARSDSRLKIIIRKMYLEDCDCTRCIVSRLPLPCKSSDLIGRIFEADPSLTEPCLIVMKRKFEIGMYNVCSCLNDVLGKLAIAAPQLATRALRLHCEIRLGYISFKLKVDGASRCLFVARVPICQNVPRSAFQRDSDVSAFCNSESSVKDEESTCCEQCCDCNDDDDFKRNTLACIEEESGEPTINACLPDRSFIKDTETDLSQGKTEICNREDTSIVSCLVSEDTSRCDNDLRITPCNISCNNESLAKIVEEVPGAALHTDDSERENEKCRETLAPLKSVRDDASTETHKQKILKPDDSITRNREFARSTNDTFCACSLSDSFIEVDNKIKSTCSNKDSSGCSQTVDERGETYSSNKECSPNCPDTNCNADTCSIASFVQNPERDKQLVELNCNRFSNNNIAATGKRSEITEDGNSVNSTKAEIGCGSSCSCYRDNFANVTDNVSEKNLFHACEMFQRDTNAAAAAARNTIASRVVARISSADDDDSLTVSVQTSRLKVSSKSINVNVSCPRNVVWPMTSDGDESVQTVIKTRKAEDSSARASAFPRRGDRSSRDVSEKVSGVRNRDRGFVKSPRGCSGDVSKGKLRPTANSKNAGISKKECLCVEYRATRERADMLRSYYSFESTSESTANERRRDQFCKFHKSRKSRGYVRASNPSNGIRRGLTPVNAIEYATTHGRHRDYCTVDVQPRTAFATAKFRSSVDRSVDRMKRLIRTKLAGILFDNRAEATAASRTFRRNERDIARGRTTGRRHVEQGCGLTSCSAFDRCKRGCTVSRESSDTILSIRGGRVERRIEREKTKFRDRRSAGCDEISSSFRSIETSRWSRDLLTPASEDFQKRMSGRNIPRRRVRVCYGKKEIKNKRNGRYYKNGCYCNFKNRGTSIMTSSRTAEISLTENASEYFERCICNQQRATHDDKRFREQIRNRNRREDEEKTRGECKRGSDGEKRHRVRIGCVNDIGNQQFSKIPSLSAWMNRLKNARKQSHDVSGTKEARKLSPLMKKSRAIFEKDTNCTCDFTYDDRLRKKRAFAILADTCNDCANDLDLDFRSKLRRYVELCKSVKRSLMKTLRQDDIYEIATASIPDNDS